MGHEINLIARAEAALMAEGNTAVADKGEATTDRRGRRPDHVHKEIMGT